MRITCENHQALKRSDGHPPDVNDYSEYSIRKAFGCFLICLKSLLRRVKDACMFLFTIAQIEALQIGIVEGC